MIFLNKATDSAEAIFGKKFGPRPAPRIVLRCATNAGHDGKTKNRSRKSFRDRHWGAVQSCKLLSKRQTMILATITDSLHVDEVGEQEVVGRIRELSMSYTFRTKGRDS